jgi:hypothetical protein
MTTTIRLALEDDWDAIDDYDDRGHGYGFPTVMAERDGTLVGYMASRPGRHDAIECHAIKADSSFVALRLMEAYEAILAAFEIKGYCFSMDKEAPGFLETVLRLPGTVQYGETADHVYAMRTLTHGRSIQSPSPNTH